MAYTDWEVVAFEQPTAAKWNQLGENDAGFKDGTNFDDDIILKRHIDWDDGIWWEELGRTTLGATADTISVTGLAAKKHLKIIMTGVASGGTLDTSSQVNGDTGSNYAQKYQASLTGVPTDVTNGTNWVWESGATVSGGVTRTEVRMYNPSNGDKIGDFFNVSQSDAAADTTAPRTLVGSLVWDSASQITRWDWNNGGSGDFAAGSEVIVLGHD